MKHPRVLYAQAVYDNVEIDAVVRTLKRGVLAGGDETRQFEKSVSRLFGKKYGVMTNSGSSANLLAFELLNLPPRSEVITPVLTFSTTIAPIIQKGLKPVFIDVIPSTYQIDHTQIEKKINKNTRVLMIPHLLGKAPNMREIMKIARKYKLYVIEDSCDTIPNISSKGDIVTTSFYASHLITAGGGGGMIMVNNKAWYDRARILRGWGRRSSIYKQSENLKDRFSAQVNGKMYDAKFIFDEVGYNMMPLEISAAFGNVQLKHLYKFKELRFRNFIDLYDYFSKNSEYFNVPFVELVDNWLCFPLTVKKISKNDLVLYLERHNIQTRPIFTGNALKQPAFSKYGRGRYPNATQIMDNGFVIGCHHGLNKEHINHIKRTITKYLK